MIRYFFSYSSMYDDCHEPPKDRPAADLEQTIQKNLCPPCLGEALRRGFIMCITIFLVLKWILQIHACFSRAGKYSIGHFYI